MAVDLADYVQSLKREIEPPGSDLFGTVTPEMWVGYLSDAFWEARLDGFLEGYTTDEAGPGDIQIVSMTGGVDVDKRWMALVVLYAGVKILRNRILNMSTTFRAKAGPVEFEQQNSATMLAEMLKQLKATKDRIIVELDSIGQTHVMVLDAYSTRLYSRSSYFGGPELTA